MKSKNGMRIIPLLASLILICFVYSVYGNPFQNPQIDMSNVDLAISQDRVIVEGINEMVERATWVVSGKYTAFESTWNISRNPNAPQKPSEDRYTEGRLYRFVVENVYVGELNESEILISHRYSQRKTLPLLDKNGNISKTPTTFTVADPLYQEPILGEEYVLFLTKGKTGYYQSPAHPFQIHIEKNGIARLCSPLVTHEGAFLQTVDAEGRQIVVSVSAGSKITDTITGLTHQQLIDKITQTQN